MSGCCSDKNLEVLLFTLGFYLAYGYLNNIVRPKQEEDISKPIIGYPEREVVNVGPIEVSEIPPESPELSSGSGGVEPYFTVTKGIVSALLAFIIGGGAVGLKIFRLRLKERLLKFHDNMLKGNKPKKVDINDYTRPPTISKKPPTETYIIHDKNSYIIKGDNTDKGFDKEYKLKIDATLKNDLIHETIEFTTTAPTYSIENIPEGTITAGEVFNRPESIIRIETNNGVDKKVDTNDKGKEEKERLERVDEMLISDIEVSELTFGNISFDDMLHDIMSEYQQYLDNYVTYTLGPLITEGDYGSAYIQFLDYRFDLEEDFNKIVYNYVSKLDVGEEYEGIQQRLTDKVGELGIFNSMTNVLDGLFTEDINDLFTSFSNVDTLNNLINELNVTEEMQQNIYETYGKSKTKEGDVKNQRLYEYKQLLEYMRNSMHSYVTIINEIKDTIKIKKYKMAKLRSLRKVVAQKMKEHRNRKKPTKDQILEFNYNQTTMKDIDNKIGVLNLLKPSVKIMQLKKIFATFNQNKIKLREIIEANPILQNYINNLNVVTISQLRNSIKSTYNDISKKIMNG